MSQRRRGLGGGGHGKSQGFSILHDPEGDFRTGMRVSTSEFKMTLGDPGSSKEDLRECYWNEEMVVLQHFGRGEFEIYQIIDGELVGLVPEIDLE